MDQAPSTGDDLSGREYTAGFSAISHPSGTLVRQLFLLFVRLGLTSFGGPAAHIAMMEEELVMRRAWLTRERFLDLLGITNLIPGPNSTELAMHVGYIRAGFPGLIVAGCGFILPAVCITTLLAWGYLRFGSLPGLLGPAEGARAALLAVIAGTVVRLCRAAVKSRTLALIGCAVLAGAWLGLDELILLLAGGILGACWIAGVPRRGGVAAGLAPLALIGLIPVGSAPTLLTLGLYFLRVGATLYGSGYVLIAFLQSELVTQRGWLTQVQLVDAIAAGQLTPGPVFSTATFVGYLLLGLPGALVATAGIFLPAFVFVALTSPRIDRLHRGAWTRAFLDSVNVASIALIIAVAIQLGRGTLTGPWQVGIALAGAVLIVTTRVNLAWIILGGAVAGAVLLR